MTYRERREARAERLREWAAKIERGDLAGYNRETRTLRCEKCMKGGEAG